MCRICAAQTLALLHFVVITETVFSPLYESYSYPQYYSCYSVSLRHNSKLACAVFCDRLNGCFGFSYRRFCKICDYVGDSSATYDPSVTNVIEDFHLSLPVIDRCSNVIGTLTFSADDDVLIHVDGVSRGWTNDAWYSTHTEVVTSACVIAIILYNNADNGGFIASTSSGMVTDASWKCNNYVETGWTTCGFDDAHWPDAVVVGDYNVNDPTYAAINPSAKWISLYRTAGVAYCRKRICP